jgi:hypothetical protein
MKGEGRDKPVFNFFHSGPRHDSDYGGSGEPVCEGFIAQSLAVRQDVAQCGLGRPVNKITIRGEKRKERKIGF